MATELMFNGVYNSLDAHQLVALVSCLVPSDKSEVTHSDIELGISQLLSRFTCSGFSYWTKFIMAFLWLLCRRR